MRTLKKKERESNWSHSAANTTHSAIELAHLKLLVSMKYVSKAAKMLTKARFIPGGFPMCSLLYFSHMFTSVQRLIRIAVSLFSTPGLGGLCVLVPRGDTGDIPRRGRSSYFAFIKLSDAPRRDASARRCDETSGFSSGRVGETPAVIVSAISFPYICRDAPAASLEEEEEEKKDRFATCKVEERPSVEERGAERLFPPLTPSPPRLSFQHLDSSRRRHAQARGFKSGGRELVCDERHARRA